MDLCDIGSETSDAMVASALAKVQKQAQIKRFPFIAKCYNCERCIKQGAFCDEECRDEYDEFKRRGIT